MKKIMLIILAVLVLWNIIVFFLMGTDKHKAEKHKWRVKESTLLLCAFLMGGVGEALGALFFHHKTRKWKFRIGIPAALIFNLGIMALILNFMVIGTQIGDMKYTFTSHDCEISSKNIEMLKEYDAQCAMILGCGVWNDKPSPMLQDRLDAGISLYQNGVVDRLLLTGDNGQENYNEIHVMFNYCLDAGIPREALFCDHAGFSTYDSVHRAGSVFQVEKMIVVTQKYHEYRALYIADARGIEAVGVSADQEKYGGQFMREIREILARDKDAAKALLNLKPKYGGEPVPITGDAALSQDE